MHCYRSISKSKLRWEWFWRFYTWQEKICTPQTFRRSSCSTCNCFFTCQWEFNCFIVLWVCLNNRPKFPYSSKSLTHLDEELLSDISLGCLYHKGFMCFSFSRGTCRLPLEILITLTYLLKLSCVPNNLDPNECIHRPKQNCVLFSVYKLHLVSLRWMNWFNDHQIWTRKCPIKLESESNFSKCQLRPVFFLGRHHFLWFEWNRKPELKITWSDKIISETAPVMYSQAIELNCHDTNRQCFHLYLSNAFIICND